MCTVYRSRYLAYEVPGTSTPVVWYLVPGTVNSRRPYTLCTRVLVPLPCTGIPYSPDDIHASEGFATPIPVGRGGAQGFTLEVLRCVA